MNLKRKNLILLAIQGIIFILLFIPGMFSKEYLLLDGEFYIGKRPSIFDAEVSFIHKTLNLYSSIDRFVGWLTIVLFLIGVVMYVFQYIAKGKLSNSLFIIFVPILELISLCFFSFSIDNGWNGKREHWIAYDPSTLFYLTVTLIGVLLIITSFGYYKVKKFGNIEKANIPHLILDNDLNKLKGLLDSGVITQAEFDAKKKQLLGL